jgi:hypothetical protein
MSILTHTQVQTILLALPCVYLVATFLSILSDTTLTTSHTSTSQNPLAPFDILQSLSLKLELTVKDPSFDCDSAINSQVDHLSSTGQCHLVKEGPKGKDYVYTLDPWSSIDHPRDIRLLVTLPRGEAPISLMVEIGHGYRKRIT